MNLRFGHCKIDRRQEGEPRETLSFDRQPDIATERDRDRERERERR